MTIRETILSIIEQDLKVFPGIPCKVISVDEPNLVCDVSPLDDSADIQDVQLMVQAGSGFLLIPKVNSFVIVQEISNEAAYVSMFGELDSIKMLDGTDGGLIKVSDLVSSLNTLEQRMTTHQYLTTRNGLPTLLDPANATIPNTTISDLENNKITHGS